MQSGTTLRRWHAQEHNYRCTVDCRDPCAVVAGLVASLARPGENVTGLTNQTAELAGKRIELLREVVPGLRRLAVMANVDNPSVVLDLREVHAAGFRRNFPSGPSKKDLFIPGVRPLAHAR
jgi:hypothetical protein